MIRYGFIGLGNLGGHLAASLLRAGFQVTVHDIDRRAGRAACRRRCALGGERRARLAALSMRDHLPALARHLRRGAAQILRS